MNMADGENEDNDDDNGAPDREVGQEPGRSC